MIEKPVDTEPHRGLLQSLRACLGRRSDRNNQLAVAAGLIVWALGDLLINQAIERGASGLLVWHHR